MVNTIQHNTDHEIKAWAEVTAHQNDIIRQLRKSVEYLEARVSHLESSMPDDGTFDLTP